MLSPTFHTLPSLLPVFCPLPAGAQLQHPLTSSAGVSGAPSGRPQLPLLPPHRSPAHCGSSLSGDSPAPSPGWEPVLVTTVCSRAGVGWHTGGSGDVHGRTTVQSELSSTQVFLDVWCGLSPRPPPARGEAAGRKRTDRHPPWRCSRRVGSLELRAATQGPPKGPRRGCPGTSWLLGDSARRPPASAPVSVVGKTPRQTPGCGQ